MDNKEDNTPDEEKSEKVDLSQLQSLDFGPNWTQSRPPSSTSKGRSGSGREGTKPVRRGAGPRQDRRPSRKPFAEAEGGRGARREVHPFVPTVDVQFLPDEAGFAAMCQAMRHSCRTYELFEIARLILAKPERYIVLIKCIPDQSDSAVPTLHISVPDGIPFEREEEAVGHVMKSHLNTFFETEVVEVEPPKGNFQYVSRCSMTGELLAPPNYHRYSQILTQHHTTRLPDVPFERFKNAIETVRDDETVSAWLESMKTSTRFTFKEEVEGGRPAFDSASDAQAFLLRNYRDRIVRAARNARFSGTNVEEMPKGNIRRSIEEMIEKQRRFPLETANGLRGRLRRQRFHIYKKGSHGVSYVCTVRRKFRQPDQVFSESVQQLIRFLEDNPLIPASHLPEAYLGIKPPEEIPEGSDQAEQKDENETPSSASGSGVHATPEDPRLKKMLVDLRWLLTEGYVTEYSDGKLYAQPAVKAKDEVKETRGESEKVEPEPKPDAEHSDAPDDSSSEPSGETWTADEPHEAGSDESDDDSSATSEAEETGTFSAVDREDRTSDRPRPEES